MRLDYSSKTNVTKVHVCTRPWFTCRATRLRARAESPPAATVAQLYLRFPPVAEHPSKLLKGFAKTPLLAAHGGKTTVTLTLNDRSFSIWDVEKHAWAKVKGEFELHVGSSSSDIRRSAKLNVV